MQDNEELEIEKIKSDIKVLKKDFELQEKRICLLEDNKIKANEEITQIKVTTEITRNVVDQIKTTIDKLQDTISTKNTEDYEEIKSYKKTIITCIITTILGAIVGALISLIL